MDRSNFTDRAIAARLVTEVLIPREHVDRPGAAKCEKNHIWPAIFSLLASMTPAPSWRRHSSRGCCHEGKVSHSFRWRRPLIVQVAAGSASADIATPEQKRACTPDVYRLCAGEIPNMRAITACLRRRKASLSDACRAVFEQ
jgi:hypothetical protein